MFPHSSLIFCCVVSVSYNLASIILLFTLCHPTSEMDFILEDREIYFELPFQIRCFVAKRTDIKGRDYHSVQWVTE